ncbi:MAG TPA: DUF3971 domain-containing protein, partial [Gammaproteobacteria bacterium]|nr:DUF3971 domain-containing protein [Gammaproteobacteria bacterium]
QQGSLTVDSHPLSFILNSVFENPLQFDRLTGLLQWQKRAEGGWSIDAKNIIASNADMTAAGDMTLMIPAKESPTINLSSTFSMKNAGRISNYLPLKIFDPELVQWLRNAFQNGEVSSGKAIVQGKLSDFPFENGKGKFEIGGTVKALNLNYAPGWPPVENINGTLLFSGSAMTAEIESGKILTTPLTHVRGVIPYIGDKAPQVLTVEADPINTDFAQQLRFIHESPLEKTLGTNLAGLDLIGPMQLVLKLSIPLKNPEAVNVRGDVTLANATLRLPTWKLALDNLHGAFHFTEKLITATNIQGTLFGENAALNISTERPTKQPGFVKVSLQSHLSMTALQKWLTVPIEKFVQGSASYYVELHLISHEYAQPSQLILTSKLRGIQIDLPEPFGKKPQETKNLRLVFDIAQGQLLQAKVAYANLLDATMRYQNVRTGTRSMIVDLNSAKVAGQFIVPLEKTPQPLQARLKYIYLPEISENNKKLVDPKILPALDFVVDNARYKDKNLGQISFNTVPNQRGLTIKSFTLNSSLLNLRAEGEWELQKNNYFTHLQGDLNTPNVSNFLNAWGLKSENLVGSGGKTDFNLTWKGAPYSPTMASMSGNIGIKLTEGRIVDLGSSTDTKMGFGRMLNIFSLQTIPRRLSLDFSDIFEKGYSFDIMKGDFKLENGNAFTRNAYFNGPIARVEIHGRVGFGARDYDLFLSVTPYVTSSLPVVATIAGGPLAGLATWLVDKVVSHEVSKVATYHYAVSGSWNNPS